MRIETEKTLAQTQSNVASLQQERSRLVQALNDVERDLAQALSQWAAAW